MTEVEDSRNDSAYAVIVEDLAKRYGSFTAVNNVSFRVKRGEIFGFLGPNGAGKSTTIRMLCGIILPTSGKAQVIGLDVFRQAGLRGRRPGQFFLFHNGARYSSMTS